LYKEAVSVDKEKSVLRTAVTYDFLQRLSSPGSTMYFRHGQLLVISSLFAQLGSGVPVEDGPRQRLLKGLDLPAKYRKPAPYTPGHTDPLDRAIDTVGDGLDPLPWRNGLGASVLGPWNKERSRQGPDLVRPPSTDKGNMANMRWSFADSHIRIEVGALRTPS
jgi:hypothetical protein